jgi:NAD(P)H-hydrate epimerase
LPEGPQRITAAAELALSDAEGKTVVVLKGHNTVVTDGTQFSINRTGNPGMATGGSGDVLTGIVTALLCQSLAPFDAARLGVHVHGLAGDLAAEDLGQVSMIASDLIHFLPKAFRAVVG